MSKFLLSHFTDWLFCKCQATLLGTEENKADKIRHLKAFTPKLKKKDNTQ